jgi:hypothetical protein
MRPQKQPMKNPGLLAVLCTILCSFVVKSPAATSVLELGLKGDGQTDDTPALQKALASGQLDLHFPTGSYLLGTVELPNDAALHFAATARMKVATAEIQELPGETARDEARPLFLLKGDRIVLEGLDAQGVFEAPGKDARGRERAAVNHLIYGEGFADLTFRRLRVVFSEKKAKGAPTPIYLKQCRNIVFADSQLENIQHGIETVGCENVSVHGNRAVQCNTITTFARSEGLRHYDNWSRQVTYQCVFRGGSPDPSRKAPRVPLGSSDKVIRGLDPQQEGYSPHLAGTYDIQISNNHAEYGRTLAWGNKGRQVIFEGNVSRFMTDYSYGVEGCENVVFANNTSINARSVGIMSMYWGDKVVITGNLILVRDEPYLQEFSAFPEQKDYWGGLLRFHHGPTSKEDAAAGSRYGAGKVIVSGNLLVNELHDQVRGIGIEGGRDVLISGNRIVNGWVRKGGEGDLSIVGNEFTSDLPVAHGIVSVQSGTEQVIVKDNVMRFTGGKGAVAEPRQILPGGTDEAQAVQKDEALQAALPAIFNAVTPKSPKLLLIEGNVIQGWKDAIQLTAAAREGDPLRFIVRGNSLDGALRITGLPQFYRSVVTDNLDLTTLAPVQPVIEAQEPARK